MIAQAVLPLTVCIAVETAEQLAYSRAGSQAHHRLAWTALGVCLHLVLLASWCWLLLLIPLGIATPLTGLSYLTIALASQVVLRERVSRRCWIGVLSIFTGFALIASR